jgi:aspartate/tyrosine/aromatic aminotransferase
MANTFVKIASTTVGAGGAANIDFTSIPQTYTDLIIKVSGRTNRASILEAFNLQFNGNTASDYFRQIIFGDGSAANSNNQTDTTAGLDSSGLNTGANATSSTFGSTDVYIPNYTSANNKALGSDTTGENNSSTSYMQFMAGVWKNSAAITRIKLTPTFSNNFVQYTTATLYGIKKN